MEPWKRRVVTVFVVIHLVGILTWVAPPDSPIRHGLYNPALIYVIPAGVWQSWDMFCPDPSNLNMYVTINVYHSDGSMWEYTMPRMDRLGIAERYEQERFRKYVENIHLDDKSLFWPDLARWVARQDVKLNHKTPVRMQFYRFWWFVPPMPPDPFVTPQPDWHSFKFYETRINNGVPQ
jgi:hypothetical protein